jgi:acyl-lipid omega-6 desaturase (Delta-12 desaturase)
VWSRRGGDEIGLPHRSANGGAKGREVLPVTRLVDYKAVLRVQSVPSTLVGCWQLGSTLILFFSFWFAAARAVEVSYALTLLLCVPSAGLLLRIFVLQHDCGHRCLLGSKRSNDWAGVALSVLTWTPYHRWRREHAVHHATSGDLDRRRSGYIQLLTVREYQELPLSKRLAYRIYRHPLFLFCVGSMVHFVVLQRLTFVPRTWRNERRSVHWTNGLMVGSVAIVSYLVGPYRFFIVHMPIVVLTTAAGVFLFYIQHFFDGSYWRRHCQWDFVRSGLEGSSYFRLPRILDWFTGSIGYHHIHHLCSSVPNYRLRSCHSLHPDFEKATLLTLADCWATLSLHLWDEKQQRLVNFGKAGLSRPDRAPGESEERQPQGSGPKPGPDR